MPNKCASLGHVLAVARELVVLPDGASFSNAATRSERLAIVF